MRYAILLLPLILCGCDPIMIKQELKQDLPIAATIACALDTGAVVGTTVDAKVDLTQAAASTNKKITNATAALCAGISAAARESAP